MYYLIIHLKSMCNRCISNWFITPIGDILNLKQKKKFPGERNQIKRFWGALGLFQISEPLLYFSARSWILNDITHFCQLHQMGIYHRCVTSLLQICYTFVTMNTDKTVQLKPYWGMHLLPFAPSSQHLEDPCPQRSSPAQWLAATTAAGEAPARLLPLGTRLLPGFWCSSRSDWNKHSHWEKSAVYLIIWLLLEKQRLLLIHRVRQVLFTKYRGCIANLGLCWAGEEILPFALSKTQPWLYNRVLRSALERQRWQHAVRLVYLLVLNPCAVYVHLIVLLADTQSSASDFDTGMLLSQRICWAGCLAAAAFPTS